jgi:hypothetical protein
VNVGIFLLISLNLVRFSLAGYIPYNPLEVTLTWLPGVYANDYIGTN